MTFINKVLSTFWMPIGLKIVSLIIFVLLMFSGMTAVVTPETLMIIRNSNFGNLIVWSYWWPMIIIFAVLFGRVWCMICPVELITTAFAKIGLQRKRPKWMLSGWAITIFYILIVFVGLQSFAIHRNPNYMAIYMLVIVLISIVCGAVYEKNTFCRYVCPVGYLIGIYSLLASFGWRVKDKKVCETCKDKSCINSKYIYNLSAKSCGVGIYPAKEPGDINCILCAGCLKSCSKYQSTQSTSRPNLGLQYVGFANAMFKLKSLKMAAMVFVFVDTGLVIKEVWTQWKVSREYLFYTPNFVTSALEVDNIIITGILHSIILYVLFPLVFWSFPWLIARLFKATIRFKDYMLNYALAFISISAMAHFGKGVIKATSRFPYFEHLSKDYSGIKTAQMIVDKELVLDKMPLWVYTSVSVILSLLVLVGIWVSFRVVRGLNKKLNVNSATYLIPVIYGGIFLIMVFLWRWV